MPEDPIHPILDILSTATGLPARTLEELPASIRHIALQGRRVDSAGGRTFEVAGDRYLECRYHQRSRAILVLGPYRHPEDPIDDAAILDAAAEGRAREALTSAAIALGRAVEDRRQRLELTGQLELVGHAVTAITAELSLDTVLRRIVDLAREVVGAQYAAIGLPNEQGEFATFVTSGMSGEVAAQIEMRPRGRGVVGLVLREAKTIRLTDLRAHPNSIGIPSNHPPMKSFLGVPILAHDELLGSLYLTEKRQGTAFTEEDTRLVELLAQHAGVAIENARLYQQVDSHKQRLQLLIDQLPEGIVVAEPGPDRISLVNRQASALLGWDIQPPVPLETFIGRNPRLDLDGAPLKASKMPLIRVLRGGEILSHFELALIRPDGKRFTGLVNAAPLRDVDGNIQAAIVVFQDITAIKDADQLKDDFLSLVSHELRTPLTTIQGDAHLLLQSQAQLDPETRYLLLSDIYRESHRLATLVENMVQLANVRAGRFSMETEPVHLESLIEKAVKVVREASPDRQFTIRVQPRLLADADPGSVDQVLRNLLTNAVKYSPEPLPIDVTAESADGMVVISVGDHGPGIDEKDLAGVFERFTRGSGEQTKRTSGMGLGLYLSKHLVEAHGGRVWIEQPPDGGTRVRFTLPLEEC